MSWTPDIEPPQRWHPQESTEFGIVVVNRNIVLPFFNRNSDLVLDLSQNVKFGRQPNTFELSAHNFPAGVILEPRGRLIALDDAQFSHTTRYFAVVQVRDANGQTATFTVASTYAGPGPLIIGGTIPAAHAGVPFQWTPTIEGGRPQRMFFWNGLDFAALGFSFDPYTATLTGTYNGSLGTSLGNLVAVQGWDNSKFDNYPSADFVAELPMNWDLLDP
jgi:hypothetical protein